MIQRMIETVAEKFNVDPLDIVNQHGKKTRDVSTAKYVCAFLLKDKMAKTQIAALLGRSNSQYAYSAIARVYSRGQEDHDFHMTVVNLCEEFGVNMNR